MKIGWSDRGSGGHAFHKLLSLSGIVSPVNAQLPLVLLNDNVVKQNRARCKHAITYRPVRQCYDQGLVARRVTVMFFHRNYPCPYAYPLAAPEAGGDTAPSRVAPGEIISCGPDQNRLDVAGAGRVTPSKPFRPPERPPVAAHGSRWRTPSISGYCSDFFPDTLWYRIVSHLFIYCQYIIQILPDFRDDTRKSAQKSGRASRAAVSRNGNDGCMGSTAGG